MLLLSFTSMASTAQIVKPGVHVVGRATDHSIRLRWAANSPALWQLANQFGYTIERTEIVSEKKIVNQPKPQLLVEAPMKPRPLEMWELVVETDDYAAVAAQAIFGKTFDLTSNDQTDLAKLVTKSRELEARFSYALFAADQSINTAIHSGLYFEDEHIRVGSRYLYRVWANVPSSIIATDTGFVFLGLDDFQPLPKPLGPQAEFGDHYSKLSWNGELLKSVYNSYFIERSIDGVRFVRTTEKPIISSFREGEEQRYFIRDSLVQNDQRYYYRIVGNTTFGESGPPSDTLSGFGKPDLRCTPSIKNARITTDGDVEIGWELPDGDSGLLRSFDLLRENPNTKQQVKVVGDIDKNIRTVRDTVPLGSNYYVIRANDKYGRSAISFPYLVQLPDSVPPLPPCGLEGSIDSSGVVSLSWTANMERDLNGYGVYRANFRHSEFIRLPGSIISNNRYVDTLKIDNLTRKIFYKVVAYDDHFNASSFSEILELSKPDMLPPVAPLFKSIFSDSLGIHLSWVGSSSLDACAHELYRRVQGVDDWILIGKFGNRDSTSFLDRSLRHKTNYQYTLVALDESGLESSPAKPISSTWVSPRPFPKVSEIFLRSFADRKAILLNWSYPESGVHRFLVYKAVNGGPLRLYKSLDGGVSELVDEFGSSDQSVEYKIVASFQSGDRSEMSKAVRAKWLNSR